MDNEKHSLMLGTIDTKKLQDLIYRVCNTKIPVIVYEFVCENVIFWEVKTGMMFSVRGLLKRTKKDFIIILTKEATEYSVVHEIAHCWLRHSTEDRTPLEQSDNEQEAQSLAKKWLKEC